MLCFVSLVLVVSTSAINCLERLVSEITYYVSSEALNRTHSLTDHALCCIHCAECLYELVKFKGTLIEMLVMV